jgi:hypothetical protein
MTKQYYKTFKLLLILVSFSILGAQCEKLLEGTAGDVGGSWLLVKMEGNLQDICLGESANFQNGTATLQCPNSTAITRSYTYENNVLTYTNSGVSYDVSFGSVNGIEKMIFRARGIERVLTYNRN